MIDPDILKQSAEQVIAALQDRPFGSAVIHGENQKPLAVIIVAHDPTIAATLAALLPVLEQRLGVECDDERA